jgi:hypothetical protein
LTDQKEPEQVPLFEKGEWWEEHWKGMPEYVSKNLRPFKTIYVHFEDRESMQAFAKLLCQTITLETKSIWYPEAEIGVAADKRYIEMLEAESIEEDDDEV